MKTNVFFAIACRLVLIFAIPLFFTFVTEELRWFFGDVYNPDNINGFSVIDDDWKWGARHYWYFWGGASLWFLSVLNFMIFAENIIKENK